MLTNNTFNCIIITRKQVSLQTSHCLNKLFLFINLQTNTNKDLPVYKAQSRCNNWANATNSSVEKNELLASYFELSIIIQISQLFYLIFTSCKGMS